MKLGRFGQQTALPQNAQKSATGRFHHQPLHLSYGLFPPHKQCLRDDGVADVQFVDAGQRGDGLDVVVGQSMAGIDGEADAAAVGDGHADAFEFGAGNAGAQRHIE